MENWKPITTKEDVLAIIENSKTKTQIIFKDSVTCGISAFAKERLQNGNHLLNNASFNYLDLLAYREVSNFIALHLDEIHQSPQILVLKNEKVIYKATHHKIEADEIAKYL